MKKILYLYLCFFVMLALTSSAVAQFENQGTSAATFLKIGIGARAQGMGSAYVAQANDVTSLYWNPSGITQIEGSQVGISTVDWISDVKLIFLGAAVPIGSMGNLGVSIISLSMGDMKVTNWEHPDGTGETFSAGNMAVGLTLARRITDRFSVGVTGKYIRESISHSSASVFAIDIGTTYRTGFKGLRLGMSLTNFGGKMTMSGRDTDVRVDPYPTEGSNPDDVWANLRTEGWPLPMALRMGLAMDFINSENMRATGSLDFNDERDYEKKWFGGLELGLLKEMVFLRGGLSTRHDGDYIYSFGGGLRYKLMDAYEIIIDYAYVDMDRLAEANRLSFAIGF